MRFGDLQGPKAYEFVGFGDIHGPKPYKFIRFGDIHCLLRGPPRATKAVLTAGYSAAEAGEWTAVARPVPQKRLNLPFGPVKTPSGGCPSWLLPLLETATGREPGGQTNKKHLRGNKVDHNRSANRSPSRVISGVTWGLSRY